MRTKISDKFLAFRIDDYTDSRTAEVNNITEQWSVSYEVLSNLILLDNNVLKPLKMSHKELKITSGYRCKRVNEIVSGVKNSQHMLGQAVDITCENLNDMWKLLQEIEVDQAIRYKNFIHVSYVTNRKNRNQYIDRTLTN